MAAVTGAPLSSCTTTWMGSSISFPAVGSTKAAISLPFRLINAIVSLLHFPEEPGHVVFCTSINIFVKQLRALQNHLPVAEEKDNGARCKKGLGVNNKGSYYTCLLLFNKSYLLHWCISFLRASHLVLPELFWMYLVNSVGKAS